VDGTQEEYDQADAHEDAEEDQQQQPALPIKFSLMRPKTLDAPVPTPAPTPELTTIKTETSTSSPTPNGENNNNNNNTQLVKSETDDEDRSIRNSSPSDSATPSVPTPSSSSTASTSSTTSSSTDNKAAVKKVNLFALAAKSAKDTKKEKSNDSKDDSNKRKKSTLEILMEEEERGKEKRNRKDYWVTPGIVVKVMNKNLAGGKYYKEKGVVEEVIDKYVAQVKILELGDVLKLDQSQLETVIPPIGGKMKVVNGAYRGDTAVLLGLDVDNFCAKVKLATGPSAGKILPALPYEDICKTQVQ